METRRADFRCGDWELEVATVSHLQSQSREMGAGSFVLTWDPAHGVVLFTFMVSFLNGWKSNLETPQNLV